MSSARIQRLRVKGWRKPHGAVIVDRTSRWGNPHKVGAPGVTDSETAVALYRADLLSGALPYGIDDVRRELAGKNLCCFCALDASCHADVLIEVANTMGGNESR